MMATKVWASKVGHEVLTRRKATYFFARVRFSFFFVVVPPHFVNCREWRLIYVPLSSVAYGRRLFRPTLEGWPFGFTKR